MDKLTRIAAELIITPLFEKNILEKGMQNGFSESQILEKRDLINNDLKVKFTVIEDYIKRFEKIEKEKKEKEFVLEKELKNFNIDKKNLFKIKKLTKEFKSNKLNGKDYDNKIIELLNKRI